MLLAAGADPNFTVRTGLMSTSSPLVTAACRAHTSVIDSLLEHPDILVNMPVSGGIYQYFNKDREAEEILVSILAACY